MFIAFGKWILGGINDFDGRYAVIVRTLAAFRCDNHPPPHNWIFSEFWHTGISTTFFPVTARPKFDFLLQYSSPAPAGSVYTAPAW